MTPAPARSHRRIHGRSHAPQAPRRVSGPVQRRLVPAPAGPVGLPRRGTTGFFARVRALPDHRLSTGCCARGCGSGRSASPCSAS